VAHTRNAQYKTYAISSRRKPGGELTFVEDKRVTSLKKALSHSKLPPWKGCYGPDYDGHTSDDTTTPANHGPK